MKNWNAAWLPTHRALLSRSGQCALTIITLLGTACSFPPPPGQLNCTVDSDCSEDSPVCRGICRGCTSHDECVSGACLPDGSCGNESEVAYVAPPPVGENTSECSKGSPCAGLRRAAEVRRPFIKITGAIDDTLVLVDQKVTLLGGPGASISTVINAPVLEIRGSSDVAIYDLVLMGGTGPSSYGVLVPSGATAKLALVRTQVLGNVAGGVVVSSGSLVMKQSRVSGNAGGGVSVSRAAFDISNSVIDNNGSATSAFGGVRLFDLIGGTLRFEFNTVTSNAAMTGVTSGVACGAIGQPLSLSSSIVYGNVLVGGGSQVSGQNCNWSYSDIGPEGVNGVANVNVSPGFVSPDDFHLLSSSPVRDLADPNATLAVDFDGTPRPQGARRDIGAYEISP